MRRWEDYVLTAIYLLIVLGSLAAAAAVLIRGDISETGVDGLFLLAVCLLFAAVFGMIAAQSIRPALEEWLARRKARSVPAVAGTTAAAPAAEQAGVAQQPSKTAR